MSSLSSRCSVLTAALIGSALALGSTLISKPAFAGTATANMTVSATVPATCTIATGNMYFGAYNPTEASSTLGQATIIATCSSGTNATVALDAGANRGVDGRRKLIRSGGTDLLSYDIFTENNYATVWGEGTNGTTTVALNSDGNAKEFNAYGAISPGQNAPVGSYSDTVAVTITY